ncbi:MAG: crossover junction endodeoxyribonuclease RuvC [Bacteroidaceae bacterium]|nr:crossover junction endodeoxyribonuclease RuvC [Bacteroidaceae bacterium]
MDKKQSDLVIMGIDPGTNVLGYSIIRSSGRNLCIEAMGVIDLRKCADIYLKLGRIHENVLRLINTFHPDELAIESPFFGKNIQSAIKLGRAQGVAIAAAIERDLVVHEYPPTKVKLAITGNGSASKEQVAGMLAKIFKIDQKSMGPFLDATDALAIAYCHHTQRTTIVSAREYSTWSAFVKSNPARVTRQSGHKTTKPSNPDQ